MKNETNIRRGKHCVFLIHVHLVFVTKYRRKIFDQDAIEKWRGYFASVCADFDVERVEMDGERVEMDGERVEMDGERVEMDGERDQVHLLINYPPKLAISNLVNSLKGVSSRLLRRDRPDIAQRDYYKGVLWSPSYFAGSCGGAPISIICQYIEQQETPS